MVQKTELRINEEEEKKADGEQIETDRSTTRKMTPEDRVILNLSKNEVVRLMSAV